MRDILAYMLPSDTESPDGVSNPGFLFPSPCSMAATFDFSFAERPPSAGSSPEGNAQPTTTASTTSGEAKAPEKTISCVSCRRRKLKCDRIKPRCGTCARLRHECEYPERRRNLGQKRRNMKELEARLGRYCRGGRCLTVQC